MAETPEKIGRVAIAQTVFHENEGLVVVRSINNGVVMHFLYFANEVRDFERILKGDAKVPKREIDLADTQIEKMSSTSSNRKSITTSIGNGFSARWNKKPWQRNHGRTPVAERRGKVVDLMAALKQSLERSAPQREPATYRVRTATKTARKRRKA
jgi:DNA end-binding protein Ku